MHGCLKLQFQPHRVNIEQITTTTYEIASLAATCTHKPRKDFMTLSPCRPNLIPRFNARLDFNATVQLMQINKRALDEAVIWKCAAKFGRYVRFTQTLGGDCTVRELQFIRSDASPERSLHRLCTDYNAANPKANFLLALRSFRRVLLNFAADEANRTRVLHSFRAPAT